MKRQNPKAKKSKPNYLKVVLIVIMGIFIWLFSFLEISGWISNYKLEKELKQDLAVAPKISLLQEVEGKTVVKDNNDAKIILSFEPIKTRLENIISYNQGLLADDNSSFIQEEIRRDQLLLSEYTEKLKDSDQVDIGESDATYDLNPTIADLLQKGSAVVIDKSTGNAAPYVSMIYLQESDRDFYLPNSKYVFGVMSMSLGL